MARSYQPVFQQADSLQPRVAIDAMGGDLGPEIAVSGALDCLAEYPHATLLIAGDPAGIERLIEAHPGGSESRTGRIEVIATHEFITHDDTVIDAVRKKPRSSMRLALNSVSEGRADAAVSGGNTAALMALARLELAMLPGINRPAIIKPLPGAQGPFWMLDLGANLDCNAEQLVQFGWMGSVVARRVGGLQTPRVALLNIGEEPGKGNAVLAEASAELAQRKDIDYVGFIEANRLFDGDADVVVADGFAGNVALKAIEGSAAFAQRLALRAADGANWIQKFGLLLARPFFARLETLWNPQEYNGASLVGLNGVVVKSHGSADRRGFTCAVAQAIAEVNQALPRHLAIEGTATGEER
jgi:glycerol-3-phosphate acyltransferase PlsX